MSNGRLWGHDDRAGRIAGAKYRIHSALRFRNARPGSVQTTCLRYEIIEHRHSFFDLVATEAVDRSFRAVIEQLQPKQWHAVTTGLRPSKHADLAGSNRGERNRRF